MKTNPLKQLGAYGQSVWLDYIRRDFVLGSQTQLNVSLQNMIDNDGLSGITSNPTIFEKTILENNDYDADIRRLALEGKSAQTIYELLSQADVQMAADVFLPLYIKTDGRDGYVSLEVNPHLAHNTIATIAEARLLWRALNRPNVFIKIPATTEGLPAIKQLVSEGININVTLLFGIPRYKQVEQAYLEGIETRLAQGNDITRVVSVASFFVSRIDSHIDPMLHAIVKQDSTKAGNAWKVHGKVAIANAALAYQTYKELIAQEMFVKLAEKGARSQRVLFASTGTKDKNYSDVKYIEALIGPQTVTTIPMETLDAYRDHGMPKATLEHEVENAYGVLAQLKEFGIDMDAITQELEDEGIDKFSKSFDTLMETVEKKCIMNMPPFSGHHSKAV